MTLEDVGRFIAHQELERVSIAPTERGWAFTAVRQGSRFATLRPTLAEAVTAMRERLERMDAERSAA